MFNFYQGAAQASKRLLAGMDWLARQRLASIGIIFLLSFGGSLCWGFFRGTPIPYVENEFSYLLAADTFAHGRMTNPPHPMGEFFETFHVLQYPTYMSKYPPGQGIFLAIGQVVFGHPIYGVWLSAGLMSAAICWMLYAWLAPRWALMGGLAAALQFGIFTYWSQSYFGGAAAALGGALIFGALPRAIQHQRRRDALMLGLGLGMVSCTRPEGLLIGIFAVSLALPWKIKWQAVDKLRLLKNIGLPLAFLLLTITILTGIYNRKVTGHAWLFPHVLYSQKYSTIPLTIFQPLYPAVHYDHKVLGAYFKNRNIDYFNYKRTWKGFTADIVGDMANIATFFFGFPLALPSMVLVARLFFSRRTSARSFLLLSLILFYLGMMPYAAKPHYISFLAPLVVLLITVGIRGLFCLKFRHKKVGGVIVIFLIALQLFFNVLLTPVLQEPKSLGLCVHGAGMGLPASFSREDLKHFLIKRHGKYLVFIKYGLRHNDYFEWVYNEADIDHAPIVWARDTWPSHNQKLLEYFKDRRAVYVTVWWDMHTFPFFWLRQ
jgi:hypothetical protein